MNGKNTNEQFPSEIWGKFRTFYIVYATASSSMTGYATIPDSDSVRTIPLINSLKLGDVYVRWSSYVHILAWCVFGAKPLSEPMMSLYQLDPSTRAFKVKKKINLKCRLQKASHFVLASMCAYLCVRVTTETRLGSVHMNNIPHIKLLAKATSMCPD